MLNRDIARLRALPAGAASSNGRILIMSDDVQLRVLLGELLLAHGYLVVLTEISATERGGDVDVVVIDATARPVGRVVGRSRGIAQSWVVILSSKEDGDHPADRRVSLELTRNIQPSSDFRSLWLTHEVQINFRPTEVDSQCADLDQRVSRRQA